MFAVAAAEQRSSALEVWRAANLARALPPTERRVERVREKLADPSACLVIGHDAGAVIAMVLAEPFREQAGLGPVVPGAGHVSMVFVEPLRQGRGVGGGLLDALHAEMDRRAWRTSSLWTRSSNEPARRLYAGRGYRSSGDIQRLAAGDEIVRCQRG